LAHPPAITPGMGYVIARGIAVMLAARASP
jgi:hypothetical protein